MKKDPSPPRPPAAVLGITRISSLQAWVLVGAFLIGLAALPLIDLTGPAGPGIMQSIQTTAGGVIAAWREARGLTAKTFAANLRVLAGFQDLETAMEDHSILARHGRPLLQDLLLRAGAGNEKAYPGHDGWLFYRKEIDALTAPRLAALPSAPEDVIAAFSADLAGRGIVLVLLPTPGKPLIHPEKFTGRSLSAPPYNRDWFRFLDRLSSAISDEWTRRSLKSPRPVVIDPTALLWERKLLGAQYLRTDSHWTPEAMQAVAAVVASYVRNAASLPPATEGFRMTTATVSARGDTAAMLKLPPTSPWNQAEAVQVATVTDADGALWSADKLAPVLLLGDSFSNIYSQGGLGWGNGAGFPEHLSARLGFSIDALTRNDGGASATRELLSLELARGRDRLAGKKVVVWQFAMRELAVGEWIPFPLAAGTPKPTGFLSLSPGEKRTVEGKIQSIGPLPRLGQTPYKDYLTAFHITDLSDPAAAEAVVLLQTMQNHELTPAARLVSGHRITLELHSWADREPTYGSTNRGELDDLDLQLQEPNFGILLP